jgi:hypothetical protein
VCKQILIDAELETRKTGQNTSDWEKSIKEAEVNIGLYCHLRRRGRSFKVALPWIIYYRVSSTKNNFRVVQVKPLF